MSLDIAGLTQLVLRQSSSNSARFWRCPLAHFSPVHFALTRASFSRSHWMRPTLTLVTLMVIVPAAAFAQAGGTPFDTGFTAIQTLFTGTIAKVASLVAIVIGGYAFAHGEPGAKNSIRRTTSSLAADSSRNFSSSR
jgi:type IV secretory pathway VirB2 component (pilin)